LLIRIVIKEWNYRCHGFEISLHINSQVRMEKGIQTAYLGQLSKKRYLI
jgi:hypothetical protein